jgi:hypothetical protein
MSSYELDLTLRLLKADATEDELLIGLGENDPDRAMGFGEASPAKKLSAGTSWWDRHAADVKTVVCGYVTKEDSANMIANEVVQIVLGTIGAKYGMGIAAYVVALAIRKAAAGWCGAANSAA